MNIVERIKARVKINETTGCWEWQGPCAGRGYGVIRRDNRQTYVHRAIYECEVGPIPPSFFVCHHCDVPRCCNPAHLFVGTQLNNMRDAVKKGRVRSGDRHGMRIHPERVTRGEDIAWSKLTENDVREIRELYASGGITLKALGETFGVCPMTVLRVVHRRIWKHVT
jgi:hypothetical protein